MTRKEIAERIAALTPEQRQRLREFAAQHKRAWKSELRGLWWAGKDANQRDGHLLRQVRNNLGPLGLEALKPADLEVTQ